MPEPPFGAEKNGSALRLNGVSDYGNPRIYGNSVVDREIYRWDFHGYWRIFDLGVDCKLDS